MIHRAAQYNIWTPIEGMHIHTAQWSCTRHMTSLKTQAQRVCSCMQAQHVFDGVSQGRLHRAAQSSQ